MILVMIETFSVIREEIGILFTQSQTNQFCQKNKHLRNILILVKKGFVWWGTDKGSYKHYEAISHFG